MKEAGTIRDRGVWSDRNAVEVGRANGQKKLRSVNKNRALAARYGFYKYPKRKGGKTENAE